MNNNSFWAASEEFDKAQGRVILYKYLTRNAVYGTKEYEELDELWTEALEELHFWNFVSTLSL